MKVNLKEKTWNEIKDMAKELGVNIVGKKKEVVYELIEEKLAETSEHGVQQSNKESEGDEQMDLKFENIDDILGKATEPTDAVEEKAWESDVKVQDGNEGQDEPESTDSIDLTAVPVQLVNREKLIPNSQNFFKPLNEQKYKELVESIKVNGILVPLIVRPIDGTDTYEIIAGENRWRASVDAEKDVLPCRIIEVSDDQAKEIMIDTNYAQRDQLTAMELAKIFHEKKQILGNRQGKRTDLGKGEDTGATRDLIAKDYKVSGMTVDRYLRLMNLTPELQEAVDNGVIAPKVGMEIGMLDESTQANLYEVKKGTLDDLTTSKVKNIREYYRDKNFVDKDTLKEMKKKGEVPKQKPVTKEEVKKVFRNIEQDAQMKPLKVSFNVPDDVNEDVRRFLEDMNDEPSLLIQIVTNYVTGKLKMTDK